MDLKIRGLCPLTAKRRVIRIITDSLLDTGVLRDVFPKKERRRKALEYYLYREAGYQMTHGRAYGLDGAGREAIILLGSDDFSEKKRSLFNRVREKMGCRRAGLRLTSTEREKIHRMIEEIHQMERGINLPRKHIHLEFMGVRRTFQRCGRGGALLDRVIRISEDRKIPIVCCNHNPEATGYFQKKGFKVVGITSSKRFRVMNIYMMRETDFLER